MGIRDLVAGPEEVQVASRAALAHHRRASSSILFVLLVGRLFVLQILDYKSSVATVKSNSLRVTPSRRRAA